MKEFKEYINEVAIQFGGKSYPRFGEVVILAGGAGSGKGFVLKNLLSIEGKVFDVDALKTLIIASNGLASKIKKETGVDVKKLNLRNPEDVSTLHNIVAGTTLTDKKKLDVMIKSILTADKKRLPNLIFDVTLKDMVKVKDLSKTVTDLGYKKENIHIVWVMNKFDVAVEQNKGRSRVVSDEILFATHEGASLTFAKLLTMGSKLKSYMNGDIYISFNQVGVDTKLEKSDNGGSYIKDANYIKVKEKGKAAVQMKDLGKEVIAKVRSYVPKTVTWG